MNKRANMINRLRQRGSVMLAAGALLALLGIALPGWIGDEVFNTRIVTGLGILLIGIGISYWVRYRALRKDTPEAARMINLERDERIQMLRAKAGNRAFWVMMALAYAGLMWVSFAANGSLPKLNDEALWWFLAGLGCAAVWGLCGQPGDRGEAGVKRVSGRSIFRLKREDHEASEGH